MLERFTLKMLASKFIEWE